MYVSGPEPMTLKTYSLLDCKKYFVINKFSSVAQELLRSQDVYDHRWLTDF